MIVKENLTIKDREFIKQYSDENYYIRKIGTEEIYEEAIDLPEMGHEYEEIDEKIEEVQDETVY